ncbi:MAG: hypothetical protein JNK82_45290 [Myxococcaceae bacterium]|nr:hypothetical protein [Myxococcaceae bacterium]
MLCPDCAPEKPKVLSKVVITALVCGFIPFVFHITSSSSTTVNGVTALIYRDYVAISAGALAAVIAIAAVLPALKAGPQRGPRVAAAVAALGLGLLQLVRGFGLT